jgi:hypothetical protein
VNIYGESSAVLAWLLGEHEGPAVSESLGSADVVYVSDLLFVEADRVLHRLVHLNELPDAGAGQVRQMLMVASERWTRIGVNPDVLTLARGPMPVEPVRALDALHLATLLTIGTSEAELAMLTLDRRIGANADALGFRVQPER